METVYDLDNICESIFLNKKTLVEKEENDEDKNDNPFADTKDADDTGDGSDSSDNDTESDTNDSSDDSTDSSAKTTADDDTETIDATTTDNTAETDEDTDDEIEDNIAVGDSVQSEEYSDVMNFGITLIMLAAQVHFWHINCHKGFEHETLQTLYYTLDSNGDKLLENIISVTHQSVLAGNELSFDFGNLEYDKEESVGILEDIRAEASDLATRFQDNQGLCGILGDISEAVGTAIYKLTQFDGEQ